MEVVDGLCYAVPFDNHDDVEGKNKITADLAVKLFADHDQRTSDARWKKSKWVNNERVKGRYRRNGKKKSDLHEQKQDHYDDKNEHTMKQIRFSVRRGLQYGQIMWDVLFTIIWSVEG